MVNTQWWIQFKLNLLFAYIQECQSLEKNKSPTLFFSFLRFFKGLEHENQPTAESLPSFFSFFFFFGGGGGGGGLKCFLQLFPDLHCSDIALNRLTLDNKTTHTPPSSPPFKVGCLLFFTGSTNNNTSLSGGDGGGKA